MFQISRKFFGYLWNIISASVAVRALRVFSFTSVTNSARDCNSKQKDGPKNIGFIGLGNMGYVMTNHLMSKGHKLHVFDVAKERVEMSVAKGATACNDITELANNSDFVITMLPDKPIVLDVFTKLIAKTVNADTLFIDSSTIDPNLAKHIHKMVGEKGAVFIDAPVSGGVPGAEKATLTYMVGGSKADFEKAKPIFECMGKLITHCGDVGMGQAAKLCNNMMLGISMVGISETMNLAIRLGLDPKTFAGVINSSTGRSWASESYNPVPGITPDAPANNDYKAGFTVDLITKDLSLASGIATDSNTPIILGAAAHNIFRLAKSQGFGDKDFSYMYEVLKNKESKC